MSEIEDKVAHLANMSFVFDMHEKLGTTKSPFLMREFERTSNDLNELLEKKEKDLEARKSDSQQRDVNQSGTSGGGDQSRRG